jgi:hypothetical protein
MGGEGRLGLPEAKERAMGARKVAEEAGGVEESLMGEEVGVRASRVASLGGRGFLM